VSLAVKRVGLGQKHSVVSPLGARRGKAIAVGVVGCPVRLVRAAAAVALAVVGRSPTLRLLLLLPLLLRAASPAAATSMRARTMRLRRAAVALGKPPLAARGVLFRIQI